MTQYYVIVRNHETGQWQMVPVTPDGATNIQQYLADYFGDDYQNWEVQTMEGQRGNLIQTEEEAKRASVYVNDMNIVEQGMGTPPQPSTPKQPPAPMDQLTSTERSQAIYTGRTAPPVTRAGSTVYSNGSQVHQSPIGLDIPVYSDPMTGTQLTTDQKLAGDRNAQAAAVQSGQYNLNSRGEAVDIYGDPVGLPGVTNMSIDQINRNEGYTPGTYTQSTGISAPDQSNGLGGPVSQVSSINQTPGVDNGLPYNMTDDVALQSLINNSAGDDAFARLYNDQGGYGNSLHADFANRNYGLYDDIYALQNPGMPGLDPNQQYANASEYLNAMGMPTNNGEIGALDGRGLWDNQFVDEYMTSERGMGSGDNWEKRSQSQYEQVVTNIAALQPAMGTRNAQSIMNMVDRSYEDYKQLTLTGDPTVQNMNFVQYLQSIGAEEWF